MPDGSRINEMNAFIHGVNLVVCGPLFPDVQSFLRIYAMTKRMALLKTQVMWLDQKLRFAPLNKLIYDFKR